jgi:competence protein ComEC
MRNLAILIITLFVLIALVVSLITSYIKAPPPTATPTPTRSPTTTPSPSLTPTPTPTTTAGTLPQLQVHFIDVGQGDCILLDQGDTDVLIDGGTGEINIVPILKQYVNGDIEVMVATHPHSDHIGGLTAVMDNFKIDRIFTNGESYDTATYNNFMDKAWKETPEVDYLSRGDTFNSDSLTFKVLNPEESLPSDINGNSIVMELDYGNISFLFTGDTQKDSESSMIAAGEIHQVTILKVAHHSSDTSSSPAFLNLVKPEVAIYMCGVNNTYGFPKADTLANLRAVGARVYGTDVCGTITVTTDGGGYTVSTTKMCPTIS